MAISALRRLCVPFLVVAVTIALLALSSGGSSKAQWVPNTPQFQPVFEFRLCNDLPDTFTGPAVLKGPAGVCAPSTATANAVADITTDFTVPWGHMAYDQASFLTAGGASETRASGPVGGGPNADGSGLPAGGLRSDIKLGLANNPCNSTVHPDFIWWDSETSVAPADEVGCQAEGLGNRWSNLAFDGTGGDIYPGQADPTSPIVTDFPSCLKKVFDPDGSGDCSGGYCPAQPNWRGAGLTQVPPGGNWQMLNNIEFAPGVLQAAFSANPATSNHPYTKLDASLGYVNLIILNDVTTSILEPNPISDFCSSLGTQGMIKGQVGATARITQPGTPGSYKAEARTMSYRDADGDGLENNFDTCAWTANTDDPYTTAGVDIDMLDPACDPFPGAPAPQFDEDADSYSNSQDWCPQVSNVPVPGVSGEEDSENQIPSIYDAANPDGGPPQDSIGDDCDGTVSPENPGGLGNSTVSNGLYFNAIHVDSVTITGGGVVDGDNDGWGSDLDPNDGDPTNPGQMTHTPMDSAGIAFSAKLDSDGDGISNLIEWNRLNTYPGLKCALFPGMDSWPQDFDLNSWVNVLDIVQLTPPTFNSKPPSVAYSQRKDLDGNDWINILDIVQLTPPTFNQKCPLAP